MRRTETAEGMIVYGKEAADYEREAMRRLAQRQAEELGDEAAAEVAGLFPLWRAGEEYAVGQRICDGAGQLYRVVQGHRSQADWTPDGAPALFVPLGATAEEPEAVPQWVQPAGAHDAYRTGERVRFAGAVYESLMDGNIWPPDGGFWAAVAET